MAGYAQQREIGIVPDHIAVDARYKLYQPFGTSVDVIYCKAPEFCYWGPAGTGKSRTFLEKLHFSAMKYPGMRGLIVRKTRESITQSAIVTFENFVLPDDGSVKWRTAEQEYRYRNKSRIVVGGMDKPTKILSSEYDLIYVQEAIELTEEDWETLLTRARHGVMPYNQVFADCNPDSSRHWILKRMTDGTMLGFKSRHQDNPVLFDQELEDWTERGKMYMEKLEKLTGVRRQRLLEGKWVAAEGAIYEEHWNEEVHLVNQFRIPMTWPRIWTIDFGFRDPMVWQAWAIDPNTEVAYRFAEIYMTKWLVEDLAARLKTWLRVSGERRPRKIICDWDAEGRATLERHLQMDTEPAQKAILDGIEAVRSALTEQKIKFVRDCYLEIDEELRDAGQPWRTEDEFDSYEWNHKVKKEKPKDGNDHGMDCVRYFCMDQGFDDSWVSGMSA